MVIDGSSGGSVSPRDHLIDRVAHEIEAGSQEKSPIVPRKSMVCNMEILRQKALLHVGRVVGAKLRLRALAPGIESIEKSING
jgi:hypothetical protein